MPVRGRRALVVRRTPAGDLGTRALPNTSVYSHDSHQDPDVVAAVVAAEERYGKEGPEKIFALAVGIERGRDRDSVVAGVEVEVAPASGWGLVEGANHSC